MSTTTNNAENGASVELNPNQNTTWTTGHGNSAFKITNLSGGNLLQIAISGAPSDATVISLGTTLPMNGIFRLPPHEPNPTLLGNGEYHGALITFANITSSQVPATALIDFITN